MVSPMWSQGVSGWKRPSSASCAATRMHLVALHRVGDAFVPAVKPFEADSSFTTAHGFPPSGNVVVGYRSHEHV